MDSNRLIGHSVVFSKSRKGVLKQTKGFYPAPLKAIDVIKQNLYCNRDKGLSIERKAFGQLAITDISKSLVKVFYLAEQYRKLSIDGERDITAQAINKVSVLGAGVMGGGIAQLLGAKDVWVRLKDLNHDALALGYKAASKIFQQAVKRRRLSKAEAAEKMAHITGALDYSGMKTTDLVIEAVVEKMEVKQKVFRELSEQCGPNTILATNTSALSVTEMAKEVKDPSKVIGIHFFNPVHRMPLVEIITTDQTSKETLVSTVNLVKRLGKTPIVVKDAAGFIVNRILLAYISEAGRILEECKEMAAIDKVMTKFGMPMGPFLLSDEVGLDVGIKVMCILEDSFGERFKPADVFTTVLDKGLLGKKMGKGFYIHEKRRRENPDIQDYIASKNLRRFNAEECQKRLTHIMINEAARCLEDGIVDDPGAIDVGMIFGTGFPPFRAGLLHYADSLGIDKVVGTLEHLQKDLNADRFAPCDYLRNLQQKKGSFYGHA